MSLAPLGAASMGLSAATLQQIGTTLARFPQVEKGVLYGSRAKGNFKPIKQLFFCKFRELVLRRCARAGSQGFIVR